MQILRTATTAIRRFFDATLDLYVYLLLLLLFLMTAYPFWYMLLYSISDPLKARSGFLLLPVGFSLASYAATFQNAEVIRAFFVSVARSTIGPVLSVLVSMLVAYPLSRVDLPGRRPIAIYFIVTMYFNAGLIPVYLLMKTLGFINSFWIYILPGIMNVYGMILIRTYIESLPPSLVESAYMDGANDLSICGRIVVPLCTPVLVAVLLFSCVANWNSYTDTLIYNSARPQLYTLQYVLVMFVSTVASGGDANYGRNMVGVQAQAEITPMSVRMAITIVTVIPISLVYPFLQRYFVKGILVGAIKG